MIARNPKTHEDWIIMQDDNAIELLIGRNSLKFKDRNTGVSINLFIESKDEMKRLTRGLRRVRKQFNKKRKLKLPDVTPPKGLNEKTPTPEGIGVAEPRSAAPTATDQL